MYYYLNKDIQQCYKTKNLIGCFVKEIGEKKIKGTQYFMFDIIFINKVRHYLTLSKETAKEWTVNIRKSVGYKNFFDLYEILDDIGSGSYGVVKLGINIKTKQKVAIKIITKSKLKQEELNFVRTEIDILKFSKHPKIVAFLDHFENSEYIFIITQYIKFGDLKEYIISKQRKNKLIEESKAAWVCFQIADAIAYLHRFGIILLRSNNLRRYIV